MWKSVLAICAGASLGALMRWWLETQLNSLFPTVPPASLIANLHGGFVIGIALAFYAVIPARFGVINPDAADPASVAPDD